MAAAGRSDPESASAAPAPPRKARPIRLAPHVTAANALRHVMLSCLDHLAANEPAAIEGVDSEGVHQSRVAIRRLRSALSLFEDYVGIGPALAFRERLRHAGRALGEARDWDVFVEETLPAYLAAGPGRSVASLLPPAGRLRAAGHRLVRRTLDDPAHRTLLTELRAWLTTGGWRAGLGRDASRRLDEPCRRMAGPILDRAYRAVLKRGSGVAGLSAEERHELRKAMKRLRYGAEFLASLYTPKEVRAFLETVEQVQEVLGRLNDAATVAALAGRPAIARTADRDERAALLAWAGAGGANDLDDLERDWEAFERAKPFW